MTNPVPIVTLTDLKSGSTARVAPTLGFNCFEFTAVINGRRVDVLDAVSDFAAGGQRPSGSGIPILFPFPNRIREGRFVWEGREYVLPVSDKFGNAIHGLCLDRPWRVVMQRENLVRGRFQLSVDAPDRLSLWPTDFIIEVDHELSGSRLQSNFRIENPSDRPLPWGLGTHPYFRLPLGSDSRLSDCTVTVPCARRWELVDCLPTGKRLELGEDVDLRDGAYLDTLKLDDVYTDVAGTAPSFDCTIIDEQAGLQVTLTSPDVFQEIVAFTPPNRSAVCLEPYTCPTDAINLTARGIDCGWRILAPHARFQTWHEIAVGPVMV